MSRFFSLATVVAIVAIVSWGCAKQDAATTATTQSDEHVDHDHGDHDHPHDTTTINVAATLCGKCGTEKGSDDCCAADAEKCASCGLTKGSILCCVELDPSVAGQDLCGKCGQVDGSDSCCDENAEKCESCGLAKGSPLCCKLKTASS